MGDAMDPLPLDGDDPTRNTLLSHVCYHTKFPRSRSNGLGVDRGSQNLWSMGPYPWE